MSERDVEPWTGDAEDADLDETPRPVRKGGDTFAKMDETEQGKRKGTRKVK